MKIDLKLLYMCQSTYSGGPNNTRGNFFDATRDPTFLGVSLFMEAIEVASIEDLMGSQYFFFLGVTLFMEAN